MDPVTLIVAALTVGVASGAGETVTQSIKDGYAGLKELVRRRFGDNRMAAQALVDHAADPYANGKRLAKQLKEMRVDQDTEIVAKAQELLAAADPDGTREGKYEIDLRQSQVGSIGDYNRNDITFGAPPPRY